MLGGCALLPTLPPPALPLLSPASLGATKNSTQVLDFAYRDKEMSLQCAVQVTQDRLTLVALGPLGQRAFTLDYDGIEVHADMSPYVPGSLPPQRILGDLELALWPLAAWQRSTEGTDWQVSSPRPGLRRVRYRGRLISEVHYADAGSGSGPWNGRAWLVNTALGYTLDLQTSSTP